MIFLFFFVRACVSNHQNHSEIFNVVEIVGYDGDNNIRKESYDS